MACSLCVLSPICVCEILAVGLYFAPDAGVDEDFFVAAVTCGA